MKRLIVQPRYTFVYIPASDVHQVSRVDGKSVWTNHRFGSADEHMCYSLRSDGAYVISFREQKSVNKDILIVLGEIE